MNLLDIQVAWLSGVLVSEFSEGSSTDDIIASFKIFLDSFVIVESLIFHESSVSGGEMKIK